MMLLNKELVSAKSSKSVACSVGYIIEIEMRFSIEDGIINSQHIEPGNHLAINIPLPWEACSFI